MTGYTQTAQQRPSCPDSLAKEQILYGTCPGLSVWYRFRVNTLELGLARPGVMGYRGCIGQSAIHPPLPGFAKKKPGPEFDTAERSGPGLAGTVLLQSFSFGLGRISVFGQMGLTTTPEGPWPDRPETA